MKLMKLKKWGGNYAVFYFAKVKDSVISPPFSLLHNFS